MPSPGTRTWTGIGVRDGPLRPAAGCSTTCARWPRSSQPATRREPIRRGRCGPPSLPPADSSIAPVPVLFGIAALELAAAVVLLPWRWDEYHRVHGDFAVYVAVLLAGHGASAALLLFAGRRERRTWLLGGYFLFRATLAPLHMLPAFLGQVPPADLLQGAVWKIPWPTMAVLHLCGLPLALAIPPAFLWAFARECPRVHRRTRLDDLARRMVPVSVAVGGAMCAGVAAAYVAGLVEDSASAALYGRFSRRRGRLERAVARRGGGRRAACAHGAGRRGAACRPVQSRAAGVDGYGDSLRPRRGVLARVLAVELRLGLGPAADAADAFPRDGSALVLGPRGAGAAPARGGAGVLPAAADGPGPTLADGRGVVGGAGVAGGRVSRADLGRGPGGPAGATGVCGGGDHAAPARRP